MAHFYKKSWVLRLFGFLNSHSQQEDALFLLFNQIFLISQFNCTRYVSVGTRKLPYQPVFTTKCLKMGIKHEKTPGIGYLTSKMQNTPCIIIDIYKNSRQIHFFVLNVCSNYAFFFRKMRFFDILGHFSKNAEKRVFAWIFFGGTRRFSKLLHDFFL